MSADLTVPEIGPDDDVLSAALKYAKAGWYVGPVRYKQKHPGSVLGDGWQRQTSRDPQVIVSWFASTDHGLFLHAGRSGALIFDVDTPKKLHPLIRRVIEETAPPFQSSRPAIPEKGHYLFLMPPGRRLGNGVGRLGGGWGDVRGLNGVIIAAPSAHQAEDGCYSWPRTGAVPVLPDYVAEQLDDVLAAVDAASDAQVRAFLDAHTGDERPELLDVLVNSWSRKVEAGESRHSTMVGHLAGAMKDARADYYPARMAADRLQAAFEEAVSVAGHGKQGAARSAPQRRSEWRGLLAWAVAQAQGSDVEAHRAHVAEKVPEDDPHDLHDLLQAEAQPVPAGVDPATGEVLDEASPRLASASGTEDSAPDKGGGKAPSISTLLVRLALKRYALGTTPSGEPYAVPLTGPRVVCPFRGGSASLRAELADVFLDRHGRVPPQQALADALLALEGRARRGPVEELHLRVAQTADACVWLDLGDATGDAVEITPRGWQVAQPPVLFRRTALTAALPRPCRGGSLDELWALLNVAEEDRPVLAAVLVAELMPSIPHPVVLLTGEQGTGKSSASRFLAALLDPATAQLRKPPRDVESWVTGAAGSWVVAVDNLSALPDWFSDSLCRASTGDGDVRRKLYKDDDLHVFAFRRCVILNGIDLGAVRGDLADRLVPIALEGIVGRRRQQEIEQSWRQAHPSILGALLDLAALTLGRLPAVRLDNPPRMADFAFVLAAVDEVLGTKGMTRYRELAGELAQDAVASDPVLVDLRKHLTSEFRGSVAELFDWLSDAIGFPPREWPKNARALTGLLRRHAPALRGVGWTVERTGRRTKRGEEWRLIPPAKAPEAGDERGDETVTNGDQNAPNTPSSPPSSPEPQAADQQKRADQAPGVTRVTTDPLPLSVRLGREEEREGSDVVSRERADFSSPSSPPPSPGGPQPAAPSEVCQHCNGPIPPERAGDDVCSTRCVIDFVFADEEAS